ncbi:putative periplasmic ligand-binding sensor protein [Gluconacetobacter diazotrophicus PA1 5]|uniref:Conserved protein n=2 Tax=Gluconacetobacter diazotrophicus TaxID=33996 RepID=A9HM79_GLUDA|nr:DUF2076 domain-containing protein [Gluconacetobacter diazotrophicus]ACI50367.1 putative periplasmic ligand-binding sensor protein [Gluconacetobacter diazotrophicus PA1 5]MBB2154714.1 DUF2076 domain-containing protein [Gluconacetobacter diazotrophicus]TWB08338.1 hypothetical protein FBZ86_10774 [Gluconacetobacter diazotrophicus]CAP56272.1 conserved protein [Gluconacetobacter diazotrophicus PA1 5]
MNNEERDLITKFVARVGGAPQGGFGSVPATAPNLPPIDPEADNYIGQMFQQYPEARYRVTQMAVVQEAALVQAQNRIQQLQWQLQQAQQALQARQQAPSGGGGLFGGLFGGGQRPQAAPPPGWGGQQAAPPPPQPAYPPGMQPGMFPARGSGFLGSALTTAAGVAGGMMVGNALTDLFSGHHDAGGFGGGMPGGETIINNNYGDAGAPGADPFGGAGGAVDPGFDAGGDAGGDAGFGGGDWGGGDDNF